MRHTRRSASGFAILTVFSILVGASQAARAAEACGDLLPSSLHPKTAARGVEANDLAQLRDFGMESDTLPGHPAFSLSQDGSALALVLRRAEPATNDFCQGLVMLELKPGSSARLLDRGGEFIRYRIPDLRGAVIPSGTADIITPAWSSDGQWILYRKRVDGHTEPWIAARDGSGAHAVAGIDGDVENIAWSADNKWLIFSTWQSLALAERAIDEEGRSGWLFDRRVMPIESARPLPQQPLKLTVLAFNLASHEIRAATPQEASILDPSADSRRPPNASLFATSSKGVAAWTQADNPSSLTSPTALWTQRPGEVAKRCAFAVCSDKLVDLWWSADGRTVRFLHRTGWADDRYTFYRWSLGRGAPKPLMETKDVFSDCQSLGDDLVCNQEGATQPRRIVRLDLGSGRITPLFDPNPEFAALNLGKVTRLHWVNSYGTKCFGDLVLPPDHRPGQRHPLIIVQYRTKKFLRGAVGDQYPIQAFAAHGYAVLSVERVPFWSEARAGPNDKRTFEQFQQANHEGWIDRRNVLSSLLTGLDLTIKMGVVEPDEVGITGVSEAAMSTWFALNNSDRFKVASVGSCCIDPKTTFPVTGDAYANSLQSEGYPQYTENRPDFWKPMSLAMNVNRITAPILMQLPDDEFIMGLEAYKSLQDYGRAVEMRIFPDEHHYEWQPAHRLAIYQRNLDWFDFWLRGIEDKTPAKQTQYARWRFLRLRAACSIPVSGNASCAKEDVGSVQSP